MIYNPMKVGSSTEFPRHFAVMPIALGIDPSTSLMWLGLEAVDARNKCEYNESNIRAVGISLNG